MSQELKGNLNNALSLNGAMNSSGNLRGMFQLGGGGGGGTTDYEDLSNKPSINGHTLEGDSDTADLQLDYDDLLNKPEIPDVSNYYTKTQTDTLLDGKVNQSQINMSTMQNTGNGYRHVATLMPTDPHIIRMMRIGPYYDQGTIDGMLAEKADTDDLATVATSGDYDDLLNKPSLATVATSGDYDDLTNKPVIPPIDLGSNNKMVMLEDHLGSTPVTTAAGSLYRSAEKTFNFSGFTNVKAIFATGANASGSTSSWIAITSRTNSSVSFVVMRYNSSTLSDYTVSFLIVGV